MSKKHEIYLMGYLKENFEKILSSKLRLTTWTDYRLKWEIYTDKPGSLVLIIQFCDTARLEILLNNESYLFPVTISRKVFRFRENLSTENFTEVKQETAELALRLCIEEIYSIDPEFFASPLDLIAAS